MNTKRYHTNKLLTAVLFSLMLTLIVGCGDGEFSPTLTETDWQWTQLETTEGDTITMVSNPEDFVLRLNADETVGITADCNVVNGTHTVDGSSLSIELGISTMAYCGDDSLDELFLNSLSAADSFIIENGKLKIILNDGAGTMTFEEMQ